MERALILVAIVLIGLSVVLAVEDSKAWNKFKVDHHCKVVAQVSPSNGIGVSSSGNLVTTYESGKQGWLCDDGITYFR